MEIFTLLETLEETIENARKMPLTNKGIVDKDELLDLIKEIRIKLPEQEYLLKPKKKQMIL